MALRFVGIDPDTKSVDSPTVWVDEAAQEIVIQGWKPSPALREECAATHVPGHAVGIPEHEDVVRLPARMVPFIRKACDDLDVAGA